MSNYLKIKFILSVFIFISVIFSGCSFFKPVELQGINNVEIKKEHKAVLIAFNLTLYNPNSVKVQIDSADINVYIKNIKIGKLKIPDNIEIKSKSIFTGEFDVKIDFMQVLYAGINVINNLKSKEIEIKLKGTVNAKLMFKHKVYNVDYTKNVKL
jgi:LEA14-like dessication related protein